ncbi:flavoprotein [Actinokineospora auranticolor]|uniref:Flavoprotein n=1 Tax=Actinokineospora auranticolor TaxID=155976 RepID=A0A2S6GDG8_9PSEU|nr:flavoprotein [Actinokineospora auranticolor]PPK63240.1 flavoprotein [Actinokineospora auranticolor]
MTTSPRSVYLVVTAAPPVLRIDGLIELLTRQGSQVTLVATPTAASWVDLDALTGCRNRVHSGLPGAQDPLPRADLVIAAPLTFNTLNKWAAGISDSLALGVLNELLGTDVPIIAAPCVKPLLRKHPAYDDSVRRLAQCGVPLLDPDSITTRADDGLATFDWSLILAATADP